MSTKAKEKSFTMPRTSQKRVLMLHCYIRPEGDHLVGMCLELDIAAQGDTLEAAKAALNEAISGYLETVATMGDKGAHLRRRPAPRRYWVEYYTIGAILWLRSVLCRRPKDHRKAAHLCTFHHTYAC